MEKHDSGGGGGGGSGLEVDGMVVGNDLTAFALLSRCVGTWPGYQRAATMSLAVKDAIAIASIN